jgi:hypothetical protein
MESASCNSRNNDIEDISKVSVLSVPERADGPLLGLEHCMPWLHAVPVCISSLVSHVCIATCFECLHVCDVYLI